MTDTGRSVATVFYDADCRSCVSAARLFEPIAARHRLSLAPLQIPGASAMLGVSENHLLDETRLRLQDGTVFGGAAAVVEIARRIWWAWPLWALSHLPGAMRSMHAGYRWVARHRGCADGTCGVEARTLDPLAFLPLLLLPVLALFAASRLPRWGFMWTMGFALYAGCKWLTYRQALIGRAAPDRLRALGYLLAWPGMDAGTFLYGKGHVDQPRRSEWLAALLKMALGGFLLAAAVRVPAPDHPLLAGWLGLIGVAFMLHFGIFHLLSLGWRTRGVNALPVMQNPLRSASLSEFWGRRWNTAFHELVARFTFRPLQPLVGRHSATLLVFLLSGLIHELVISVPAQSGYGLPTGYFLVQGLGVAAERTRSARRLGFGRGWRGWLFTVVVAGVPAFWLFPPSFIRQVILPMLAILGRS